MNISITSNKLDDCSTDTRTLFQAEGFLLLCGRFLVSECNKQKLKEGIMLYMNVHVIRSSL